MSRKVESGRGDLDLDLVRPGLDTYARSPGETVEARVGALLEKATERIRRRVSRSVRALELRIPKDAHSVCADGNIRLRAVRDDDRREPLGCFARRAGKLDQAKIDGRDLVGERPDESADGLGHRPVRR